MRPHLLCLSLLAAGLALGACKKDTTCPTDQLLCDGACVAVNTDRAHCGTCENACGDGFTCSAGACECPAPRTACGDACVDLSSDPQHCGDCAFACGPDQVCATPEGGAPGCALSCPDARPTVCGAACVSLQTDTANCGACGRTCDTGERCSAGRCVADLYLACFNTAEIREATAALAPAGVPQTVPAGPLALAALGGDLYATSASWGGAEALTRIRRDPPAVRAATIWGTSLTPDIEALEGRGGYLFLSHTSAKSLLVLSPGGDGADTIDELFFAGSQDPNPNPLGIAFTEHSAYVALQKLDEVAVVDLSALDAGPCTQGHCLAEAARIDVSSLKVEGAKGAMPSSILVHGTRAYVALWNLDENWQPPAGSHGRLAVIDTTTDTLDAGADPGGPAGLVDLGPGCLNPAGLGIHGTTLYVTCGGFGASGIVGGGIVPVDLSGAVPAVGALIPVPAAAAPGELAFCGDAGYVGDRNSGRVFRLDPAQNAVAQTAELCPKAKSGYAYVADVLCGE